MIEELKNAIERYEKINLEFDEVLQSSGKKGDWDEIRGRANKTWQQIESIYAKIKEENEKWEKQVKQAKILLEIKNIKL